MSLWTEHKRRWEGCTKCSLCESRKHVVLARGSIPCTVLFCGEGPGQSEDVLGQPFIGPAGHLLDAILERAGFDLADFDFHPVRRAFTNLVCCLPLDEEGNKTAEPPKDAIEACSTRLREFISMAQPRAIVCVGGLSEKWVPKILERDYGSNDGKSRSEATRGKGQSALKGGERGGQVKPTQRGLVAKATSSLGSNGYDLRSIRLVSITHPAAILRANEAQKPLMVRRCVVTLSDLLEELATK